ncbi:RNA polymerase-associated protein LEO1 [Pseudohyphozyma bogoriensis]|nr:RNA polymerase-associated protein LEO1 [Pseudohyphozyma bogoriensis]
MEVDNPEIVPTTLEQDLLGDAPDPGTSVPDQVVAREQQDLDDLPSGGMMGAVETADEDIVPENEDDSDDAGGLFGDDDDEDLPPAAAVEEDEDDEGLTAAERAERERLEYNEGSQSPQVMEGVEKQEAIAQIELANFGIPESDKVWHAKLPNFLALKPQAFDEMMWEPEEEEEELKENAKTVVPDEYVVRWRWAKDAEGKPVKESNSRIVRWSDGSLSLQIGNELFDISASLDHSAPIAPGAPNVPPLESLSTFPETRGHGLTYLTAEHRYSQLIEAQASIHGTLTFRPTNLNSETHRRLAANVQRKYEKKIATKMAMTEEDPERKKAEREKAELEKQKKARNANRPKREPTRGRKQTRFLAGDDDDEDNGDDDMGYDSGRRSQPKRGEGGPLAQSYSDDEDADGFVVGSEDEDSEGGVEAEYSEDDLDDLERAAERADKADRANKESRRRDKSPEASVQPRRRMVVDESDEE